MGFKLCSRFAPLVCSKNGSPFKAMITLMLRSLAVFSLVVFATDAMAEPYHVYFGTSGRSSIGIYHATFDPDNGKLTSANLAAEVESPGFLAMHPDGDKLYAVGVAEKKGVVAGYQILANGDLQPLSDQLNPGGRAAHIAVHPNGKFLLTAQYGGGSIALFPLDSGGKLGKPTIIDHKGGSGVVPKRQNSPHPHWCGFSPDGNYALVPDLGLDQIVIYRINHDEVAIEPHGVAQSVPGGGPRHMRFSHDGKYIYLLNELTLSVTTFAWDAETGIAETLTTTPALSEAAKAAETFNSAAEILVHPNGKFVYSSNRGHDSISVYQADSAGKLEVVQVQPVRGAFPRNINLDPTATWVLAAGADSKTIAAHRIDSDTGKLTYQRGAVINVPDSPICILFGNAQ